MSGNQQNEEPISSSTGCCLGCLISPVLYAGVLFILSRSRIGVWEDPINFLGIAIAGIVCGITGAVIARLRGNRKQ